MGLENEQGRNRGPFHRAHRSSYPAPDPDAMLEGVTGVRGDSRPRRLCKINKIHRDTRIGWEQDYWLPLNIDEGRYHRYTVARFVFHLTDVERSWGGSHCRRKNKAHCFYALKVLINIGDYLGRMFCTRYLIYIIPFNCHNHSVRSPLSLLKQS